MTEPLFLIDTNIVIYILADSRSVATSRVQALPAGSVVTSSIAYAEVARGFWSDRAMPAEASLLFNVIQVLSFDAVAAEHYAKLPFRRGSFDRLIAAHALSMNLTLVTANEREFRDVPGLRVENWAS